MVDLSLVVLFVYEFQSGYPSTRSRCVSGMDARVCWYVVSVRENYGAECLYLYLPMYMLARRWESRTFEVCNKLLHVLSKSSLHRMSLGLAEHITNRQLSSG